MADDRDPKLPRYVRKPPRSPRLSHRETWALELVLDPLRSEHDPARARLWLRALEPYVDDPEDFAHRIPEEHRAAFLARYDGSAEAFPAEGTHVESIVDALKAEHDGARAAALLHELATWANAQGLDRDGLASRLPASCRDAFCAEYAALH